MNVAMSGVVLAGGASRRMGTDKALMHAGNEPFVTRAVRTLARVCTDVVVASGDGHRLDHLGLAQVADTVEDAGPLAGIAAGLIVAASPLVAVLAVDMPSASPAIFRLLAGLWRGEAAVVPIAAGRWEPLHAVWARSTGPLIEERLQAGDRAVRAVVRGLPVRFVAEGEWACAEPDGAFAANINTPDDITAVRLGV